MAKPFLLPVGDGQSKDSEDLEERNSPAAKDLGAVQRLLAPSHNYLSV